jgi:hypothetical protein
VQPLPHSAMPSPASKLRRYPAPYCYSSCFYTVPSSAFSLAVCRPPLR